MDKKEFENKFVNLDECVINALELFIKNGLPELNLDSYKKPMVVGSGNAFVTGKILFNDKEAIFADESTYESKLNSILGIDGAVLISSSGGKHAPIIAKKLKERKIEARLLTCNKDAPAKEFIDNDKFFVFPKNSEPYTYNTSTYLGMVIAKTKEEPKAILDFINKFKKKIPKNLKKYDSFYFIIPEKLDASREMFLTKFDELFGSRISGRVFTMEQSRHARSVVLSDKELFVGFGSKNTRFGIKRLNFDIPKNSDFGLLIAMIYYFIGNIQKQNKPYFKESIFKYCKEASKEFKEDIEPIVE